MPCIYLINLIIEQNGSISNLQFLIDFQTEDNYLAYQKNDFEYIVYNKGFGMYLINLDKNEEFTLQFKSTHFVTQEQCDNLVKAGKDYKQMTVDLI
jgi:hypothetical protein